MDLETAELSGYLDVAIAIAKECGEVIRHAHQQPKDVELKEGLASDLVTKTDQAVEALIRERIAAKFPSHLFLGEEDTAAAGKQIDVSDDSSLPVWVIDPIDGTTNFVQGIPYFCVSIGVAIARCPVVGVVYNPITEVCYGEAEMYFVEQFKVFVVGATHTLGLSWSTAHIEKRISIIYTHQELYAAGRGLGATFNGAPLITPQVSSLAEAVVSWGFAISLDDRGMQQFCVENLGRIIAAGVRAVRRFGSCALDMCAITRGLIQLHSEYTVHPWDVCAAVVILEEAGGVVWDPVGQSHSFDLMNGRVLAASSRALANAIVDVVEDPPHK